MLLAHAVAVVHAAAVLFMLTGALVALLRPRILLVHAPLSAAILAVNLTGAACPLTTLELALRARAGAPGYRDGFLGHHVFAPLGLDVDATSTQLGMNAVAFGLNALGYGLVAVRIATLRAAPRPGAVPDPP